MQQTATSTFAPHSALKPCPNYLVRGVLEQMDSQAPALVVNDALIPQYDRRRGVPVPAVYDML
eukprot:4510369-Pyramimonas_sp.AAC.1